MKKLPSWLRWVCGRLIVIGLISLVMVYWEWLSGEESGSTTLRNLGLMVAGVIALWFAYQRSCVADRQAETSHRGLLNERYQKGAEMLGSEVLSVRLGGIYALQRLAEDEPEQYHIQIMRLFCAFVRHPTEEKGAKTEPDDTERNPNRIREDVQAVLTAIRNRRYGSHGRIALEKNEHFFLILTAANLADADLIAADLNGAVLTAANLTRANLTSANLTRAHLADTNLTGASLAGANLTDACLTSACLAEADLTDTVLFGANGLTQVQLDQACADPDDNPPDLRGLCDAETGAPLKWRSKPCRA